MTPKIQTVSYSEIDAFRQCPFKWQVTYDERWVGPTASDALVRGKLVHLILEQYYLQIQQGINQPALAHVMHDLQIDDELIVWMMGRYASWAPNQDLGYRVVAVEKEFNVDLGSHFHLKGKIDLILQDSKDRIWLADHKTCSRLPTDKDLDLDPQFTLYAWALKQLGVPVYGLIYNALRTQRNQSAMSLDQSFSRTLLVRTDRELETAASDALADAKISRRMKLVSKGTDLPRHYNTDTCGWRCGLTEACLFGAKGGPGGTRAMLSENGFVQDFTRH